MEVDLTGVNEITHPVLDTWQWHVALYLFLGGLVAGLMIFSGILRSRNNPAWRRAVRIADFSALPLLGAGVFLLWLDLSNRFNVWRFLTTLQIRSAMSWGVWILTAAAILIAARLLMHLSDEPARAGRARHLHDRLPGWARRVGAAADKRAMDVAMIVIGIALGAYTGLLLSTIPARPLWNSAVLAPLFLVSGMASGGAFLCLFLREDAHRKLAPASLTLCGVELVLLGAFVATLAMGSVASQCARDLLFGGYGTAFWTLVVGLGLVVPATIEGVEIVRRRLPPLMGRAAPTMKLVGGMALRFVIVFAGLRSFI